MNVKILYSVLIFIGQFTFVSIAVKKTEFSFKLKKF